MFNVAFNNRDDHPKNFSYLMSAGGAWTLAPAYDVTFCEGPDGCHQMDVMGQALEISRTHLLALGEQEAELSHQTAGDTIDRICNVAVNFSTVAKSLLPGEVTPDTLRSIQSQIERNVRALG